MSTLILKGNIIHTPTPEQFDCVRDGYLISENNQIKGIFAAIPERYAHCRVLDYGNALIIPGLYDLHIHAPQFPYRGLGLDLTLMDWLDRYAYPTEARFQDPAYAALYYDALTKEMAANGTCRAVMFGSIHPNAAVILMEQMEKKRIGGYAGKINMDLLCPDMLREDPDQSLADTKAWIEETKDRFSLVGPAITPRFIPTCSTKVLEGLGKLAAEYEVPIHSHISEDPGEMAIVRERYPAYAHDGAVYDSFGLLTGHTVMAHLVFPAEEELALLKERGVTIAHCPQSNANVREGVAPVRRILDAGIRVGLGSDIAGGFSVNILRAMSEAVLTSKLHWLEVVKEKAKAGLATGSDPRISCRDEMYLTVPESFYLGTKGGGSFFGKCGSFEAGYEMDAVVIDDRSLGVPGEQMTLEERIERAIHLADDRHIVARYVAGEIG